MRVMVTGGRYFNDYEFIKEKLTAFFSGSPDHNNDVLVHGGCRGCDKLCARVAEELGIKTEEHPADWKRFGRFAGPIRNEEMLKSGVSCVLAFPGGKGTKNAIKQASAKMIPVYEYRPENQEETESPHH